MFKEFKQFALRGNLIDMAVAFVMGAAFSKVVSAFIDGMVLPLVGLIQGRDFSNLYFPLSENVRLARQLAEAEGAGLSLANAKEIGPVMAYGNFITVTIEFVIVSLFMFLIIKAMNKLRKSEEVAAAAPEPNKSEQLLEEIRDALKKG
jgi:large conductance mechanosensitive channel